MQSSAKTSPPLISEVSLILEEQSANQTEDIRDLVFKTQREKPSGTRAAVFEEWFRKVSGGPQAVRDWGTNDRVFARYICWKKDAEFDPKNIYTRTVDTSRVLPIALADFRIQWYFHPNFLQWLDSSKKPDVPNPRRFFQDSSLVMLLFPILLMRNMHDYGGGDLPIITVNWTSTMLNRAFDHWVAASEADWCEDGHAVKVQEVQDAFLNEDKPLPCFHMVDHLVRALLSDEDVGYVPRFIVFRVQRADSNTPSRALFAHPDYQPPPELIKDFPIGCGCDDPECVVFDFKASRALKAGSAMVRRDNFPFKTVRCNFWPCQNQENAGSANKCHLVRCQKCKEVLYCGSAHQLQDWKAHKRVCERQQTT